jgi:pantetheine-phosphate adenylyltransferase
MKAIYAGSFDPISLGHIDIIKRSIQICSHLTIGIGVNSSKKTLFSEEERMIQINRAVDTYCDFLDATRIKVVSFQGLLVNFAKEIGATILIRGIRSVSDFEYEITLASANKVLAPGIDTIFLPTSPELAVVSSSLVKEVAKFGGDVSKFTTRYVAEEIQKKFGFVKNVTDKCPHCGKIGSCKFTDDKPSFQYCRECGKVV